MHRSAPNIRDALMHHERFLHYSACPATAEQETCESGVGSSPGKSMHRHAVDRMRPSPVIQHVEDGMVEAPVVAVRAAAQCVLVTPPTWIDAMAGVDGVDSARDRDQFRCWRPMPLKWAILAKSTVLRAH